MSGVVNNIMVILSSPSGVGKTTITKKIQQKYRSFKISVSHTTRKPRSNEIDGVDYHFVTNQEFEKLYNAKKHVARHTAHERCKTPAPGASKISNTYAWMMTRFICSFTTATPHATIRKSIHPRRIRRMISNSAMW